MVGLRFCAPAHVPQAGSHRLRKKKGMPSSVIQTLRTNKMASVSFTPLKARAPASYAELFIDMAMVVPRLAASGNPQSKLYPTLCLANSFAKKKIMEVYIGPSHTAITASKSSQPSTAFGPGRHKTLGFS